MKKKVMFVFLFVLFISFLTGCNNKEIDYKLQIRESSWSGWTEDYVPEEVTNVYDVKVGEEYNIDSGNLRFTIKKVNSDSIVIETVDPFSDNEKGVDLNSKKKEFTITLDKEKELTTPTMDEGHIYYLKLVK